MQKDDAKRTQKLMYKRPREKGYGINHENQSPFLFVTLQFPSNFHGNDGGQNIAYPA